MIATWPAPLSDGRQAEELLLAIDRDRPNRVLLVPASFDEANKLRRFSVDVMRKLDAAGIDTFLPDVPGCNESLQPLEPQTLATWKAAYAAAARHVRATHFLAVRAGALVAPDTLPGWQYAAQTGPKMLRSMLRARMIASREQGREETSDQLSQIGRSEGVDLAGWRIGAPMFQELEGAEAPQNAKIVSIAQKEIGGAGLWLRAEPSHDEAQAEKLASIIAGSLERGE